MAGVLIRERRGSDPETEEWLRWTVTGSRDRDWSDVSTSQAMPETASSHWKCQRLQMERSPADPLILDFQSTEQ